MLPVLAMQIKTSLIFERKEMLIKIIYNYCTLLQNNTLQILNKIFTLGLYSINSILSSSALISLPPSRILKD